jgi:hypothetical protein
LTGDGQRTPERSGEALLRSQSRASFQWFQKSMLGDEAVSEATRAQEVGSVIPIVDPCWESGQSVEFPTTALPVVPLAEVLPAGVFVPMQPENARAAATRTRTMGTGSRIMGRP